MEREKVNWEKYSDSEASLVFSREAVRIIVKEIVEITLKSPYETSVTQLSIYPKDRPLNDRIHYL